jgi:3-hydroxyacyl-CoA dehydrogenase / enoyl-CoA hydratase / 3-hydroxybutyryl-CoA epimerase
MANKKNGNGERRETLSVEKRPDGVAVVRMDVPGESMNTLQPNFAAEFARVFNDLAASSDVKGVVFTSGKPDSFIAGADVRMLKSTKTASDAAEMSRAGHEAMAQLETFGVPVVAAIHGACLGGGLEVALSCRARVASDDRKTKLGLPEVQLGLLPGLGGTQRLPRQIGVQAALDLMLTGKQIDARRAFKLELVDEVVSEAILVDVAAAHALRLTLTAPQPKRWRRKLDKRTLQELALAKNALGRRLLFQQARKRLLLATHGNYPAPERILAVVRAGLEHGMQAGLEAEAQAFGELVVSPQAAELMNLFFATMQLKKDRGVDDTKVEPREVEKIGVLGAGLMGAGIAYVTANAGIGVRLKDKDDAGVAHGYKVVREILDGRVKRKRMAATGRDLTLARITGTTNYSGFADAGIVVEAVFEELALKQKMVQDVEKNAGPKTIFASNTSSLPIARIAEASVHPERVIGMHYFSPVHKMPLLEVIVTDKTAPWVTATCVALGKKQGKTVIVVKDGVGFYTSRILAPYMNEAAYLISEDVPVEKIDRALVEWGFPVGPITLLDEVGIDVGEKVGHILENAFGARMKPPPGMEKLVADQRFGRKNGRGFYVYETHGKKKSKQVDPSVYDVLGVTPGANKPSSDIVQRAVLSMLNEAARCFEEGILRSARDGDIGAIFGLGFPPFRGGPLRYVDAVSASEIVRRLERFRGELGERFAPAPLLVAMAESGATFYADNAVKPGELPRDVVGVAARA